MLLFDLKANLTALLGDLLGTYTYENKSTTPALYIGTPPLNVQRTGLELILPHSPAKSNRRGKLIIETWEFYLNQHKSTTTNINTALKRLQKIDTVTMQFVQGSSQNNRSLPTNVIIDTLYVTWSDIYPA